MIDNARGSHKTNECRRIIMWHRIINTVFVAAMFTIAPAHAAFEDELTSLQQRWATARYEVGGDARKKELEKLAPDSEAFAKKYDDKAESHLWAAVVHASLAEAINNLSALALAKQAKAHLEKSIELDPKAEDGYALAMLGAMYSRAPGWPVAFGSDEKAQEYLKKALQVSPGGMNVNYFNAQYQLDQENYKKAFAFIEKAAQATPPYPPQTSLAVSHRQREIREMAEKIKAKLK